MKPPCVSPPPKPQDRDEESCADHTPPPPPEEPELVGTPPGFGGGRVHRAQWLRAGILGATDGLISTTSLMLGVAAAKADRWSMILSGAAGAVAGACSMAVGEFVSVSTQRDIERTRGGGGAAEKGGEEEEDGKGLSLNPIKAAAASAVAFMAGSLAPLLSGMLVPRYWTRVVVIVVVASAALAVAGGLGARLGGAQVVVSGVRVVVGGWIAMGITYGLLKQLDGDSDGL